jgi:nuclear transcription factor Y gamma
MALLTPVAISARVCANSGFISRGVGQCTQDSLRHSYLSVISRTDEKQVNQGLHGAYRDILSTYWQQTISALETETHDYKIHQLPLARIKKVMKADPEVKMISAEAPILFAKGCDIFITELTMRAWIHAEENKRRTLQRSDIASALAKSDMFDFLIDIVPREEAASHAKRNPAQGGTSTVGGPATSAQPSGQLLPPQTNVQQQPQPGHPQQQQQHHMGPPDYSSLGNNPIPQEQEYRPQPGGIYAPQVPPDQTTGYVQPPQQMFEGMYGYPQMAPQQVCYISHVALFSGHFLATIFLRV